ncbi:MAG: Nif3-like dinuclear metal center hexameric protein, partial [Odoribacter sp.]|nr:Nif3-like dinuclear metal center hexameric protein [Odoribacter sp.]
MKVKDISSYLDSVVPVSFQESYDNSGLQVGNPETEINSALISLDVTEDVIEEAISQSCDLIISHHPLIFNPLKKLTGKNYVERVLISAVKHDIAIYSSHTNLDILKEGVSRKMAEKLNLQNVKVLSPLKNRLLKLVTYIPEDHLEKVREAVFDAGAGVTGNYDKCSFSMAGTGSFRGGSKSAPFAGEKGKLHFEKEIRFETILLSHLKDQVVSALVGSHPYEEAAYDIYSLENEYNEAGPGCVGELSEAAGEKDFLKHISIIFNAEGVKYSKLTGRKVKKVALCGGAGISLLDDAVKAGADAFVTSDIRY